ncbi:MAG: hypothetical protein V2A58_18505 [Planctomycetota bacterium]
MRLLAFLKKRWLWLVAPAALVCLAAFAWPRVRCPNCLAKLHWRLRFDVLDRCRRLADFCDEHNLPSEARWFRRRLARLDRIDG